jgi:hypothetical protein
MYKVIHHKAPQENILVGEYSSIEEVREALAELREILPNDNFGVYPIETNDTDPPVAMPSKEKFWVIYDERSEFPVIHEPKQAHLEAEKYAKNNPGTKFFILEAVAVSESAVSPPETTAVLGVPLYTKAAI